MFFFIRKIRRRRAGRSYARRSYVHRSRKPSSGSLTRNASYRKHRQRAHDLAQNKIAEFNAHPDYNFKVNRITIRNQRSRWGSCSRRGNLNFNYRIALLPPELADYIIVHELCHLGQFNHSRAFWDLVARTVPDHMALRKRLKKVRFQA